MQNGLNSRKERHMSYNIKKMIYLLVALVVLVIFLHMTLTVDTEVGITPPKEVIQEAEISLGETTYRPTITEADIKYLNQEIAHLKKSIEEYKKNFNTNLQKLSDKKWITVPFDKLEGISDSDYKILQENNSLAYYMQSAYLPMARIKAMKLGDKKGAIADLMEFKQLIDSNKYIVQNEHLKGTADNLIKQYKK